MEINHLMDLVNAKVNDDARRSGVMTLGALRSALAVLPPETIVAFESGSYPSAPHSYRGYYERLALEPGPVPTTAADVIGLLDSADGDTFQGYKGGDYVMDGYTFLHVANYGDIGDQVVGLHTEDDRAVIETREEEW